MIITCIDYRFQEIINKWLSQNFQPKTYDRGAFAGAAKSLDTILNQIDIAKRLHHIKKVILINHEDCGAYGEAGTAEKHKKDLQNAKSKVLEKFPDLQVETYYLHLNGTFKPIS